MNYQEKSFLEVCLQLPQYVNWGNSCIGIVGNRKSQMQACFKTSKFHYKREAMKRQAERNSL